MNESMKVFRPERIPTLSRLPKEVGREDRCCERCEVVTEHIFYRVPKRVVLVYVKEHDRNLHATCILCARSEVLTGEERKQKLEELKTQDK